MLKKRVFHRINRRFVVNNFKYIHIRKPDMDNPRIKLSLYVKKKCISTNKLSFCRSLF
jgi:hypothetical protein